MPSITHILFLSSLCRTLSSSPPPPPPPSPLSPFPPPVPLCSFSCRLRSFSLFFPFGIILCFSFFSLSLSFISTLHSSYFRLSQKSSPSLAPFLLPSTFLALKLPKETSAITRFPYNFAVSLALLYFPKISDFPYLFLGKQLSGNTISFKMLKSLYKAGNSPVLPLSVVAALLSPQ